MHAYGHMGSSHLSLNSRFVGLQSDGFGKREITPLLVRSPSLRFYPQLILHAKLWERRALIVPHGSVAHLISVCLVSEITCAVQPQAIPLRFSPLSPFCGLFFVETRVYVVGSLGNLKGGVRHVTACYS